MRKVKKSPSERTRRTGKRFRFSNILVVIGSLFLLTGFILLLQTTDHIHDIETLWPVPFIILGLFFLYLVIFHHGPPRYIFSGIFLSVAGCWYLILNTLLANIELSSIWPTFMGIAGVALIIYGLKRIGGARIALLIPGITIVILSLLFLFFSLDLVERNVNDFARIWWPFLLILIGTDMIIAFCIRRIQRKDNE